MDADFNECTRRVLAHEGGWGWDRRDPGGPTNYGITYIDYAEFKGEPRSTASSWADRVKAMPLADAMSIYKKKYWDGMQCDKLPYGIDYAIYDYGINSGPARPARVAQALLKLPVTGRIDAATIGALNDVNPVKFIDAMCDERLNFMKSIRGGTAWSAFGKGWGIRVAEVRSAGTAMAMRTATVPAPTPMQSQEMGKATHVDQARLDTMASRSKGAATGGLVAGAGVQASGQGPYVAVACVVGIAIVAGIVFYVISSRQQKAQATVNVAPIT